MSPVVMIKQDSGVAIAILIISELIPQVAFIYLSCPRDAPSPTIPTSIAAQVSLFAGSSFVQGFTDNGIRCTKENSIWN